MVDFPAILARGLSFFYTGIVFVMAMLCVVQLICWTFWLFFCGHIRCRPNKKVNRHLVAFMLFNVRRVGVHSFVPFVQNGGHSRWLVLIRRLQRN